MRVSSKTVASKKLVYNPVGDLEFLFEKYVLPPQTKSQNRNQPKKYNFLNTNLNLVDAPISNDNLQAQSPSFNRKSLSKRNFPSSQTLIDEQEPPPPKNPNFPLSHQP